jgi:hypothetical protein
VRRSWSHDEAKQRRGPSLESEERLLLMPKERRQFCRGLCGWANCFLQDKPMSDIDAEIAEGLIIVANVDKKQWTHPMSWV